MAELGGAAHALVGLGFSEYEARTYLGLLGDKPVTGYAVAKATGVPMPKVYETLDRLASRGVAFKVDDDPALWIALPTHQLLAGVESDFRRRIAGAEVSLRSLEGLESGVRLVPVWGASDWELIKERAAELIERAEDRVYLSGRGEDVAQLAGPISAVASRGARVHLLTFGPLDFNFENAQVVRHRSTEGVVFPRHRTRHLAVSIDASAGLWAIAPNGGDWTALSTDGDDVLPSLVRGFIRHDMFVQIMYADLGPLLEDRYGPGLQGLYANPPAALEQAPEAARGA
jgi:HTH-type transcriptional regulator, sugar sensing transcriptional regulator